MAAGDRNKKGKPKDIVRHGLRPDGNKTLCGRGEWWYATTAYSWDVDCLKCLAAIKKLNQLS